MKPWHEIVRGVTWGIATATFIQAMDHRDFDFMAIAWVFLGLAWLWREMNLGWREETNDWKFLPTRRQKP
jgi:hypothetical protein